MHFNNWIVKLNGSCNSFGTGLYNILTTHPSFLVTSFPVTLHPSPFGDSSRAVWSLKETVTEPLIRRRSPPTVSLRLGHGAALTAPRAVIHYRAAASLPQGEGLGCGDQTGAVDAVFLSLFTFGASRTYRVPSGTYRICKANISRAVVAAHIARAPTGAKPLTVPIRNRFDSPPSSCRFATFFSPRRR